jgi:hypothetical protein
VSTQIAVPATFRLPCPSKQRRLRLVRMCQRLSRAGERICRALPATGVPHNCIFCRMSIHIGDIYRDRDRGRIRAHEICFQAVAREDWGAK